MTFILQYRLPVPPAPEMWPPVTRSLLPGKLSLSCHTSCHSCHAPRAAGDVAPGDPLPCCSALLKACQQFVDLHAADILGNILIIVTVSASLILVSEGWLTADISVVRSVLCRSSLHISTELAVSSALTAWSAAACSRLSLDQSPENMRSLAAGCQYLVRCVRCSITQQN